MPPYLEGIAFRVPSLMGGGSLLDFPCWAGFGLCLLSLVRLSKRKVQVLLLWQMPSGQM